MPKALLVNDTYDWYHHGCTGTSTILRQNIQALGYELSSFSIAECSNLKYPPLNIKEFFAAERIEKFLSENQQLHDLLKNSNIVVINGEGTLHGVKKGPLAVLYIAYLAKNIFAKNVQIINHSVYPHDDLSIEPSKVIDLYKTVYAAMDFTAIREPVSFALMRNMGLANVTESFDCLPVYIKDHYQANNPQKKPRQILLAGSAAWFNLNVFIAGAQPEGDVINGLLQLIEVLQTKIAEGYEVSFLQSATQNPAKDDQEMVAFLNKQMGESFKLVLVPTLDAWLQAIQEAGLLISGRFHHSIAATCLGTKFIALNSNTPKMLGLMTALGYAEPLNYGFKDLKARIHSAFTSPTVCADPTSKTEELCAKAANNFVMLQQMAPRL